LRNTIVSLKNLKATNAPNQQQQQQLQAFRNNIENQKNTLSGSLQHIREELLESKSYSDFFDNFVGYEVIDKIDKLTSSTDSTDNDLLLDVDQILLKSYTFSLFYNSIAQSFHALGIPEIEQIKQDALILTFENEAFIDDLRGLKKHPKIGIL
jgi:soluble cytochrome b562